MKLLRILSIILILTAILLPAAPVKAAEPYYTIVVVPDTQWSTDNNPDIINSQMNWIVSHRTVDNIVFVAGLGDITEGNVASWATGKAAYNIIRTAGIPYSVVSGNHDANIGDNTTSFNLNFPYTDFTGYSWYGGHFPSGPTNYGNQNSYQLINISTYKFIILNIQVQADLDPTTWYWANGVLNQSVPWGVNAGPAVYDWANGVLSTYSDRLAIIVTHANLVPPTGRYEVKADSQTQDAAALAGNVTVLNQNVVAVLSGHWDTLRNSVTGIHGNTIHNLQSEYSGGQFGYLRYYRIYPATGRVDAFTYSPWLSSYLTTDANQFTVYFPMRETEDAGRVLLRNVLSVLVACSIMIGVVMTGSNPYKMLVSSVIGLVSFFIIKSMIDTFI